MDYHFTLDHKSKRGLQKQLKDHIALAIIEGRIPPHAVMPSSRRLAKHHGISRNTVVLAYAALQEDGFLSSRERSGFYVNPDHVEATMGIDLASLQKPALREESINWADRLTLQVSQKRNIVKPTDWRDYKYGFIYGQIDPSVFPVHHWRECWRDAVGVQEIRHWSQDLIDRDDELLVDQIRTRLLPRRGLWVDEAQILVTVGAQNALYIALKLLLSETSCFGMEEPGYPDARNIAEAFTSHVKPLRVDEAGLKVGPEIAGCDVVYSTPSHHSPTTVTMPEARRRDLLQSAEEHDFVILEDDYEAETNFNQKPLPALKTYDTKGRVIYIGSLSKTLAPGLRLGYLVGSEPFIQEARALRRLIMRHPAANNQRAAAYFLSRGHHESLLRALVRANQKKRKILHESLTAYLPEWRIAENQGGSSFWITGPKGLDARRLALACQKQSVLIEPGNIHFMSGRRPYNQFRLGYTSIPIEHIEDGVKRIARVAETLMG